MGQRVMQGAAAVKHSISSKAHPGAHHYLAEFQKEFDAGVFEGVRHVLVSGAGSESEVGGLVLLAQRHGRAFTVDGV